MGDNKFLSLDYLKSLESTKDEEFFTVSDSVQTMIKEWKEYQDNKLKELYGK